MHAYQCNGATGPSVIAEEPGVFDDCKGARDVYGAAFRSIAFRDTEAPVGGVDSTRLPPREDESRGIWAGSSDPFSETSIKLGCIPPSCVQRGERHEAKEQNTNPIRIE